MAFQAFTKSQYPRRQWLIEGEAGSGKSTLVTRLKTPMLIVDADHRFDEVVELVAGQVFQLSDDPLDHVDPDRIAELVTVNIKGSGTKTIVVDSLTPIIAPLTTKAFRDNRAGQNRNKVAAYAEKATAVRLLQDSLTRTGCDTAWIYHIYEGRDSKAQEVQRTSITELELSRILRSCNMRLRTVITPSGVYAVQVVWARRGRDGMVIEDPSGSWETMPERIEEAVYGGLTEEEMDAKEKGAPDTFPSPAEAIRWGMDQVGELFKDEAHAQNAYNLLKDAKQPKSAREMRDRWVVEVEARKKGESTVSDEERADVGDA
jgi:hypothetical protein